MLASSNIELVIVSFIIYLAAVLFVTVLLTSIYEFYLDTSGSCHLTFKCTAKCIAFVVKRCVFDD